MYDAHHQILVCGQYGRSSSPAYASPSVKRSADHHRASSYHVEMVPSLSRYQYSVVFHRRPRRRATTLVVCIDKSLFHLTASIPPPNHTITNLLHTRAENNHSIKTTQPSSSISNHFLKRSSNYAPHQQQQIISTTRPQAKVNKPRSRYLLP
jgi:hypothetical protein